MKFNWSQIRGLVIALSTAGVLTTDVQDVALAALAFVTSAIAVFFPSANKPKPV